MKSPTSGNELAKLCPADLRSLLASTSLPSVILTKSTIPNVIFIIKVMSPSRNELECPVCFAEMKPPVHIWQCAQVVTILLLLLFLVEPLSLFAHMAVCPGCCLPNFFVQTLSLFEFLKLYRAECHHLISFISF